MQQCLFPGGNPSKYLTQLNIVRQEQVLNSPILNARPRKYSIMGYDMMFSRLSLALNKEQLKSNCEDSIHTSCRSESSFMCLCRLDKLGNCFQTISLLPRCNYVWFCVQPLVKRRFLTFANIIYGTNQPL